MQVVLRRDDEVTTCEALPLQPTEAQDDAIPITSLAAMKGCRREHLREDIPFLTGALHIARGDAPPRGPPATRPPNQASSDDTTTKHILILRPCVHMYV